MDKEKEDQKKEEAELLKSAKKHTKKIEELEKKNLELTQKVEKDKVQINEFEALAKRLRDRSHS